MVFNRRWVGPLLDLVWLAALAIYALAGVERVPFHGDESTLIYMSRDYYTLVQTRQIDPLLYRAVPPDPMDQELRIINGTVAKLAMGLAWDLAGMSVQDVNPPWVWEWSWDQNVALGHLPSDRMLRAARLSSAVLLAVSVAAVFAITRLVARSRSAAWAASLIYATNPAVLLNGRRAMMEGALLCFTALVVLAAVLAVREQARGGQRGRRLAACYAALGITAGFALASKHNTPPVIAAVFAAAAFEPLIRRRDGDGVRFGGTHIARILAAGLIALLVFLALNPAWWSDPLHMPGRVLDARTHLLDGQIVGAKNWGGYYWQANDRMEGLLNQAFFAGPQYYEVPVWREYVGEQIAAYDGSWLAGRGGGVIWGALLIAAFAFGAAQLIDGWRDGPAWVVLVWMVGVALALLALTPFEWQRYYLPLQAPIAVIAGTGVWRIGVFARAVQRGSRKTVA